MHDSGVLAVSREDDGSGFVLFHGYVYRSAGNPGHDPSESGWQNVRMRFTDMTVEGPPCEPDAYVSDGDLTVNGAQFNNMIPFSASNCGKVCLSMCVAYDFEMRTIRGASISIEAEGEFKIEAVWDTNGHRTAVR
jgi:hypothetical protein